MIERTLSQHTWTAPHVVDQHVGATTGTGKRRRLAFSCRTEERGQRNAHSTREMHDTRIIRHAGRCQAQHTRQCIQGRRTGKIVDLHTLVLGHERAHPARRRCIRRRPHQHAARLMTTNQSRSDVREMHRRPSLGAAVRGPRRHHDERTDSIPPLRPEQIARCAHVVRRDDQLRLRRTVLDAKPLHQPAVVLRLMNAYRRARHRARQKTIAQIGRVTPSLSNACALNQPRRRKRIREQDAHVSAQGPQLHDVGLPLGSRPQAAGPLEHYDFVRQRRHRKEAGN